MTEHLKPSQNDLNFAVGHVSRTKRPWDDRVETWQEASEILLNYYEYAEQRIGRLESMVREFRRVSIGHRDDAKILLEISEELR